MRQYFGDISAQCPALSDVEITACADIRPEAAAHRAAEYGLRAMPVEALVGDPEIDLVLNLTIPAAHFDISMQALAAGKHVFTEKPLAVKAEAGRALVTAAASRGLALGSAPDTFLGAAGRQARRLMEEGAIGAPVTGTAFMMGRGMEHWHPDPGFYYQAGAGPVMDMGPYYLTMMVNLMGPVRRVQAVATSGQAERPITAAGPKSGTRFAVGTPTSVLSLLEFAGGATVTFGASWDVFRHSTIRSSCMAPRVRCACRTPTISAASSLSPTGAAPGRRPTPLPCPTAPSTGRWMRRTGPTTGCWVWPSLPVR